MVRVFFEGLRRLSLGIALLAIAGTVLLLLDLQSRKGGRNSGKGSSIPRIAFVQHASIKAIDDGRVGAIEQLKQRGYVDGETVSIKYFNAEGDIGTANAIAKEVTSGS
jgi:putative ABC transport system substrate-binding protein